MTFGHQKVTDRFQRLGLEQADVVANPPPIEIDLLLPVADAHDVSQGAMLLSKILEFVVVQIAAQAGGSQHDDLPIVEPFSPTVAARMLVDILSNKVENLIPQLPLTVNVLQGAQDGNHFVATVSIELHFGDSLTIQPRLA